jgi:hypothetical protein
MARAAFEAALAREMATIREEAEAMLRRSTDPFDVWAVHDFLSRRRREVDEKYDYRYSVLILVFARLLREGWLRDSELAGLSADKLERIQRILGLGRRNQARPADSGSADSAPDQGAPTDPRSRRQRDRA